MIRLAIPGNAGAALTLDDQGQVDTWAGLGVKVGPWRRVGARGYSIAIEGTPEGLRTILGHLEYRAGGAGAGWSDEGDGEARACRVAVERIKAALAKVPK